MESKLLQHWIRIWLLVLLNGVVSEAKEYCKYRASSGDMQIRECDGKCCTEGYYGNLCCNHGYPFGPFVGAGIGLTVIVAIVALCAMYICCKRKIAGDNSRLNATTNTRINPRQTCRESIPSVSVSVEPTYPPPYEVLPPPYYSNEIEMGEHSGETKDETKKYPDYPPPEYTQFSETGT